MTRKILMANDYYTANTGFWASLRRIKALIIKEFFQMIRDPSSILIGLVLPLLLTFLYGYGVSLDADHIRLGVVMQDTSPDAQSFVKSLTNSRYFDVIIGRDKREFDDMITAGHIRGLVIIPPYFSQFRNRPSTIAPIMVIGDGSEPNTASFAVNYVRGAFQNWLEEQKISEKLTGLPLVRSQTRYWYNEQLESRHFLIPGSLAIIMTLIGTLLTAMVMAREWERGTMEALMSTPVTLFEVIIGKLVPYFALGMLALNMCFIIAVDFYDIPFRGSYWMLILVSSVFLYTALSVGLLISTISRNQFVAAQAAIVASFLPGLILSGFVFEITTMPTPIRLFTYLIPARYYVTSLHTLFLAGNIWYLLIISILPMLAFGITLTLITIAKSVKRLD